MSIATFTILVIAIYLIIIKIVAYFAYRLGSENVNDYFITERKTNAFALLATLLATGISAMEITGTPAMVYEGGILFSQMFVIVGIALFIRWYYAPRIWTICKQNNFMTQAELFGHHYRSPVISVLTVIICICAMLPFLIVQFAAVAKVFSSVTENLITYELSILLLAFVTGGYVFFGGARAVIWTDMVQGVIFLIIFFISAYLFTVWAGGYGEGVEKLMQVIPDKMVFNSENTPIFVDRVLSWTFAFFLFPQIFQRLMMGSSPKTVRRAAIGSMVIAVFILGSLMTMGIMATATLYGQIDDRDQLVAEMYRRHLPVEGGAMIVLAVFACGMSTIDSMLLTLSSIFTRDVAQKFYSKPLSEKGSYNLAKAVSLTVLLVSAGLALSQFGRGYVAPLATFGATFATLLLWPFIGMFSWEGATKAGVIAAISCGFIALVSLSIASRFAGFSLPIGNSTAVFFISLVSFIVVSLLTSKKKQPVPSIS